ncbi:uncharacterized protein EV422DRAFT_182305 [Fimicolochytrium jonesii]|uniref:uncharacterized protein n=1 Tax=Fimicolochytrium jonesii TaxID=1396493 RepID=UPI0022FEB2B4|nr:uncharacterized protein EV422DRAFT_182305 [Fimicolochytrium jonesii]KAI8818347.1 hypothetical protein EV422DRAFT_182305 [Fimicolochytrium jonesii]
MSEKFDGVRALWDHSQRTFVSRLGNRFQAPAWFTKDLPLNMTLDGELWGGHGSFQTTSGIVKTELDNIARRTIKPVSDDSWRALTYQIFDTPSHASEPFEKRMAILQDFMAELPPDQKTLRLVPQRLCTSREHLMSELKKVEKNSGEGLMLRQAESVYEGKRSKTLLKVKTFMDDECMVLDYTAGKGKHAGRVGALVCLMRDGRLVVLGSGLDDHVRENPPEKGTIVTFRYMGLTQGGVPRFATYMGERVDFDPEADASKEGGGGVVGALKERPSRKKASQKLKKGGISASEPQSADAGSPAPKGKKKARKSDKLVDAEAVSITDAANAPNAPATKSTSKRKKAADGAPILLV